VVFRVEVGDDEFIDQKTGKRKLFDVIVEIPVNILSVSIPAKRRTIPIDFIFFSVPLHSRMDVSSLLRQIAS
jgi:hypothetical protein